jgi:hypothetical protein
VEPTPAAAQGIAAADAAAVPAAAAQAGRPHARRKHGGVRQVGDVVQGHVRVVVHQVEVVVAQAAGPRAGAGVVIARAQRVFLWRRVYARLDAAVLVVAQAAQAAVVVTQAAAIAAAAQVEEGVLGGVKGGGRFGGLGGVIGERGGGGEK